MKPAFPEMNPSLEDPEIWVEVHSWLIVLLARSLNPQLTPKYRAAVEKRIYTDAILVVPQPTFILLISAIIFPYFLCP
ncbi:MAG: DUF4058 family protein [Oculatellaceae cyanobacterium Prado106]|jgi:hypothetical protein|nr:DUF4058 family protein [Oculatellaceae cyanobacterium Prado106]